MGKGCSLLAFRVEIDTTDLPFYLVETDVIKPLEASTLNVALLMVRDQKVLLPPHEYMLLIVPRLIIERVFKGHISFGMRRQLSPSRKSKPMLEVDLVACAPTWIHSLEGVSLVRTSHYFACEERLKHWVLGSETPNHEITR